MQPTCYRSWWEEHNIRKQDERLIRATMTAVDRVIVGGNKEEPSEK